MGDTLSPRDRDSILPGGTSASPLNKSEPRQQQQRATSLQDDDLKLARILQEQERAFHLLSQGARGHYAEPHEQYDHDQPAAGGGGGEGEGGEEEGEIDDEELARRLQLEDDLEHTRQMYAAQGVDIDNLEQELMDAPDTEALGYEDLTTLGEVAGHVSKGLPAAAIAALPLVAYTTLQGAPNTDSMCCICQCEFERDDVCTPLPCRHVYHNDCLSQWLGVNKVCPVCNTEICPH